MWSLHHDYIWSFYALYNVLHACCCFSHVWLFVTQWTIAHQPPPSVEFTRQEYWNGFPFPSARDLPDPGIEPMSLTSPELASSFFFFCLFVCFFFTTSATWEAHIMYHMTLNCVIPIIYLLQTECLGPQIHMLKSNTQCNDFWRWGLWGVMRLWEQNPPEWDYCPYKIDPTKIPQPSSM